MELHKVPLTLFSETFSQSDYFKAPYKRTNEQSFCKAPYTKALISKTTTVMSFVMDLSPQVLLKFISEVSQSSCFKLL